MRSLLLTLVVLTLSNPVLGETLPSCGDIFTDPPSENVILTPPPGMLEPPLEDLECGSRQGVTTCIGHSGNSFAPGDHDFDKGSIGSDAELIASGVTARLYFNNLDLNNAKLNLGNPAEHLFIYVKGDLKIAGHNEINAIVYVAGSIKATGNASIDGALAAGGNIDAGSNSDFVFDPDAIDNADLGGMCTNETNPPLTCFSDDFSGTLDSSKWATKRSSGNFNPAVVNGRLQLTQAVSDQSTAAAFLRLFPGANNLVTLTFNQYGYGGSGADGMAVVLSDARLTPQPGAFGGPLGYGFKTGVPGFAGGWLGIGIDEYGNYSNEGGAGSIGRRPNSVVVRGSGSNVSGYRYLIGSCNNGASNCLTPPLANGQNGVSRFKITVDSRVAGQSMVKVERDTGTGFSPLFNEFDATKQAGQAAVPDKLFFSLTGSTGGSSNVHEIDNVEICAIRSESVGSLIDHFEFDHSGQALTCKPESITIRACANADCSTLFTEQVSATLTPANTGNSSWSGNGVNGNVVTFTGGTTTLKLNNRAVGSVTLGVSQSTPATKPLGETKCRAGGGALSAASCTLAFADSGFLFVVQDTLANKPQQVQLKAVKKDDATQKCVPGFASVSKPVSFWSDYISPATNGFGSKVTINGSAIGTSQGVASPQTLAFNAQGEATLTVSYPDAGKMQLNASHDGSGETAGLVMIGSDPFVSSPAGLCITPVQGVCMAGDASCPVFKKTGEAFQLNIGALAWQSDDDKDLCSGNLATPNFELANIALGSELVAPKPGVEATVGKASYDHVITTSSNLNSVSQSVNEVGIFRMTATPPAAGYFGYTIPPANSVPVGRFVPWDFQLVSGTITPACGEFSYMGQPFGVQMTVQARNQQGGITRNYRDAFAKGLLSLVAANDKDGVDRSERATTPGYRWAAGVVNIDDQGYFVRRAQLIPSLTAPEEPLRALRLGVQVTDAEATATTFLTDRDMNPGVKGDCQAGVNCTARQIAIPQGVGDTMIAYYGRLLASTRQGVDSAQLALPLQVQYFEAGQWRVNQQDVCSQVSLAGGGIDFTDSKQRYDAVTGDLILQDGTRIHLGLGNVAPGGTETRFSAGETRFHFAPPNQAVRIPYRILLEQQPSAPRWLADPAMPDHLTGEAIFGSSRGNDRIIYRREAMPQN